MPISVFNLFSIGIGPSSSHTVGPMRASLRFLEQLDKSGCFPATENVRVDLYGSLALTGKGHSTDIACLLGLEGETPDGIDPDEVQSRVARIRAVHKLNLWGKKIIPFNEAEHLLFHKDQQLPYHPNAVRYTAIDKDGKEIFSRVYYSVGGGFVVDEDDAKADAHIGETGPNIPLLFHTSEELLAIGREKNLTFAQIMMENEKVWRSEEEIRAGLLRIWHVMKASVTRGIQEEGVLPGGLNVKRRAKSIYQQLTEKGRKQELTDVMEWVSLWALAVNEENAAAGRVVTAPTNGSAGVIPAVMHFYERMVENASDDGICEFLLTAGAIGILYKLGASISAAEMGCMGEVGVACSMAAAALTGVMGGTNAQMENAAEIGMEHNLGLTCDPPMGLVQIPCIERNTMGAVKAINAALLAMRGDGSHRVSLDQVIATMRETGRNMQSIYKETALGGLAVNVPEC